MKKIFLLTALMLASSFATADLLYWFVADNAQCTTEGAPAIQNPTTTDGETYTSGNYSYMRVRCGEAGSTWQSATCVPTIYYGYPSPGTCDMIAAEWNCDQPNVWFAANIGESASYSSKIFFFELLDANQNTMYVSDGIAASTLSQYISQAEFSSSFTGSIQGYGVSSFTCVPEPTSALLMLLGANLLALRRRKIA